MLLHPLVPTDSSSPHTDGSGTQLHCGASRLSLFPLFESDLVGREKVICEKGMIKSFIRVHLETKVRDKTRKTGTLPSSMYSKQSSASGDCEEYVHRSGAISQYYLHTQR